jgi:menaquinone-dependent protoporphyrinogen oxidase
MKVITTIFIMSISLYACGSRHIPMPTKTYGDEVSCKGRVLVTYATRAGSTIDIADSISFCVSQQGYVVDLMHVSSVENLSDYSTIVIGSAIRMGNVTPEVKRFVQTNKEALQDKPTAYFIACLTLHEDTPENRAKVKDYLIPLREIVTPFAEGYFAGKMDYAKLKPFSRFAAKRMVKAPEGDFRDWEDIRRWSTTLLTH